MNISRIITMATVVMLTAELGRIQYNNHDETWYNLPMNNIVEKAQINGINDEYWERKDGCKMYGKYILCAGAIDRYGEIVETSRGLGIILDTGDFAKEDPEAIDLAVTW